MKKKTFLAAIALLATLTACAPVAGLPGNTDDKVNTDGTTAEGQEGSNPGNSHTESAGNSIQGPKVFVDLDGYCPEDEKMVYFTGTEEPGSFRIIDADTREEVFKGVMNKSSYGTEDREILLMGNFSSLKEEGTYYIEAPHIGRSYSFSIGKGHYEAIEEKLKNAVLEGAGNSSGDFLYRTQALSLLLHYQEYYGKIDEDGTVKEIPDLLLQGKSVGENLMESRPEEADYAELAFYCGAMAQLYEELKVYDAREANPFLREAESVYKILEGRRYEEGFDEVWLFYDSALLYKATGYARYHNVVKTYLAAKPQRNLFEEKDEEGKLLADEAYVFGSIAYLRTVFNVDTNLCAALMSELTEEASVYVGEHDQNPFFCISEDRRNRLLSDRLYLVAVVEHVIVSKEYVQALEDGIHYINGCNETGESYLTGQGVSDAGKDEKGSGAAIGGAYLFILGEITESEAAE